MTAGAPSSFLTSVSVGAAQTITGDKKRDAIATPAAGLVVYNTTTNKLNFYNGSAWEVVTSA